MLRPFSPLRAPILALAFLFAALAAHATPAATTTHINFDQIGYLPTATKIAVISNPLVGFNAGQSYVPGATLQVRDWNTDAVVFSAAPAAWNGGSTDPISGDQCWWFDFSSVTAPGRYYIWDDANAKGSGQIQIGPDVYRAAAIQVLRSYFYQRCGQAKLPPFAPVQWSDQASFIGANQDSQCRFVSDLNNPATTQDLHGGWADAGNYEKYTTNARGTLQSILLAYEDHPAVWGEDHGIPESGNGIPDILNEAKWEIDWLLRMQQPDGSVLSKVDAIGYDSGCPPSTDVAARYYGAASTSATLAGADVFAHAAIVFGSLNQPAAAAYASTLRTAAVRAWIWAQANPGVIYNDSAFNNGDSETESTPAAHAVSVARAACLLFALTGDTTYRDAFDANYTSASIFQNPHYLSPYDADVHNALLYYLRIPGGTAEVKAAISSAYRTAVGSFSDFLPAAANATDAYRAYLASGDYTWGSNGTKMRKGTLFTWIVQADLDPANANAYREAAAGFLHYLHGTNPLGVVYMSNMGAFGVTNSISQYYGGWWGSGPYSSLEANPAPTAPGYIPGGPDLTYAPDASYSGPPIAPPMNQPAMKSYLNWNIGYPQDSWEVTENDINYSSAYVQLVAAFLAADTVVTPTIAQQPASLTTVPSGTAVFSVAATGSGNLTYQWCFDGQPISGATGSSLVLNSVGAAQEGSYTVVVGNGGSLITSQPAALTLSGAAYLANLSARAAVAPSASGPLNLYAGFFVAGTDTKNILVRGIGPALANYGVSGSLALPRLTLYDGGNSIIAANSGWSTSSVLGDSTVGASVRAATANLFNQLYAFALPNGSPDAALLSTLPFGQYTAQVDSVNGASGVALVELYDADGANAVSRLINISARGYTAAGSQVLTAGFVVGGSGYETVLIRGVGPALAPYGVAGVVAEPSLLLFDSSSQLIATNTGWGNPSGRGPSPLAVSDSLQAATGGIFNEVGAFGFPAGSADCALVATLPPGSYTAEVQAPMDGPGVALVEVYRLP